MKSTYKDGRARARISVGSLGSLPLIYMNCIELGRLPLGSLARPFGNVAKAAKTAKTANVAKAATFSTHRQKEE